MSFYRYMLALAVLLVAGATVWENPRVWYGAEMHCRSLGSDAAEDLRISACTALITVAEADPHVDHPHLAHLYRVRAAAHYAAMDIAAALADYDKSLQIDPHNTRALRDRARIQLANLRNYEAAAADFSALLALSPQNFEARISRSYAFRAMGDAEAARADITIALAQNVDDPQAAGQIRAFYRRLDRAAP